MVEVFKVENDDFYLSQVRLFSELYKKGELEVYGVGLLIGRAVDLVEWVCHRSPRVYHGGAKIGFDENSRTSHPVDRSFIRILCKRMEEEPENPTVYRKPRDLLKTPWEDRDVTIRVGSKDVMSYANTVLYRFELFGRASIRGLGARMPTVVAASNIAKDEMPQAVITEIEIAGKREVAEREGSQPRIRAVSGLKIELEI